MRFRRERELSRRADATDFQVGRGVRAFGDRFVRQIGEREQRVLHLAVDCLPLGFQAFEGVAFLLQALAQRVDIACRRLIAFESGDAVRDFVAALLQAVDLLLQSTALVVALPQGGQIQRRAARAVPGLDARKILAEDTDIKHGAMLPRPLLASQFAGLSATATSASLGSSIASPRVNAAMSASARALNATCAWQDSLATRSLNTPESTARSQ